MINELLTEKNVLNYVKNEIINFNEIYKDDFSEEDSLYYIFGRIANRFEKLQILEVQSKLENALKDELSNYYSLLNNIVQKDCDMYVNELLAYGFFENIKNQDKLFKEAINMKLNDKAKSIYLEVEKFWNKEV